MLALDKAAIQRGLIYSLIFCSVVSVVYWTRPKYDFAMKGIALPWQTIAVDNPSEDVRLFPFPPARYTKVGIVNIEQHFAHDGDIKPSDIEQYAKTLAARMGANAIIVTAFGHTSLKMKGPAQGLYVFRGIAARVPDEVRSNHES